MKPGDAVIEWVHVNNLVQAHLLTIPALSSSCDNVAVRILILSLCLNYYVSLCYNLHSSDCKVKLF